MKLATAFSGCLFAVRLWAGGDFAPIPQDVWAIKEGPKGAVVLEDRMRFTKTTVDYVYRTRIFAEAGRGAAEIEDFPESAFRIKGRTVYPDGHQVEFSDRKDFAERTVEGGGQGRRKKHLLAPGVTTDCVVEVSWSEYANGRFKGLPHRFQEGLYGVWRLANAYPSKVIATEVLISFPLAWSLHPGMAKPEIVERSGYKIITLRDVPPVDPPPYSLQPTLQLPQLVIFWQPPMLSAFAGLGANVYWKEAGGRLYRNDYEDSIDKGGAFKLLAMELTNSLPSSPAKAATELMARLDARIANLSQATFAEAAALPKSFWSDLNPKDLAQAAKTGRTSGWGMKLLYFHLLKAAGLKPIIAKVPSRDQAIFSWEQLNPWQFNRDLIGIEEPGAGTLWCDPSLRYAMPGVVLPDCTAVPALFLDGSTWAASRGSVNSLPAASNTRRYTYRMELGDEGDAFDLETEFSGYPEYAERNRFRALEPAEQSRLLKEQFEKAMKNLAIGSAEVLHTSDAKTNVGWRLKGTLEREPSRKRAVDPFPGMPWPLWVPAKLEPTRTAPVVLPNQSVQLATSTFKVPKGYTMGPQQEVRQQNGFGRVFWVPSFDTSTGMVKVQLRVEVTAVSAPASQWDEFKTFLGWIEDACRRQVVLTKEG